MAKALPSPGSDRTPLALAAVDQLLRAVPELADPLLDLRLTLGHRAHAGRCIRLYFEIRAALPVWRRGLLTPLGDLLADEIQIQIALADSVSQAQNRARRCLGLDAAPDLQGFCESAMRQAARDFPQETRLQLRFGWVSS